jgi:hypothetical protein
MGKLEPLTVYQLKESERGILQYLLDEHILGKSYFGKKESHYKMCNKLSEKLKNPFIKD